MPEYRAAGETFMKHCKFLGYCLCYIALSGSKETIILSSLTLKSDYKFVLSGLL